MNKQDRQFVIEGTAKILVSFIPGIGGALGSILSDTLADRKEQRIKEFLNQLETDILANKDYVNKEFLKKEDFLDVFEITAIKISQERTIEKRIAFKNILVAGILSNETTYDDVEYNIRILDNLNANHLILLKLFHNPESFTTNVNPLEIKETTLLRIFKKMLPDWQFDFLYDHLTDLENNRLVEEVRSNLRSMATSVTIEDLKGKLTSKGMSFVEFVIR